MLAESDDDRMQGQVGFVGISCSFPAQLLY